MNADSESPGGIVSDQYFFRTATEMELMFSGHFTENVREIERRLGVTAVARDLKLKISSSKQENVRKAMAFLEELNKIYSLAKKRIDQRDFLMALSAFQESRETELQNFFSQRIKVSPKKQEIVPRTPNQLAYVKAVRTKDVVFGIGPAGTGKTYLAMALAVSELLAGRVDRIVLTRPAVEAGENLGFLPGKIEEKINPYLRPLYDALYDMLEFEEAAALIDRGIIEVAPLAFMRGRTLNNSFIILDEAQNASREQMLMFLTRLGFHSKCVVAGDPTQIDLPGKRTSGLIHAVRRLERIPEIAVCAFNTGDVVRHSLVEKIVNAYQNEKVVSGGEKDVADE